MPRISGRIITWIFLLAVAALLLLPIVLAVLGSFKTNQELNADTSILPSVWQFENYMYTWKEAKFSRYVWNSLIYSISATLTTIIVCALASYAVARKDFPGKKVLLGVYSAMMFIHMGVITLKPAYQIMVMLGLHKSIFGLIIMMTGAGGTTFFILYPSLATYISNPISIKGFERFMINM